MNRFQNRFSRTLESRGEAFGAPHCKAMLKCAFRCASSGDCTGRSSALQLDGWVGFGGEWLWFSEMHHV